MIDSAITSSARAFGGGAAILMPFFILYLIAVLLDDLFFLPCLNPLDRVYTTAAWTTVCFLAYNLSLVIFAGSLDDEDLVDGLVLGFIITLLLLGVGCLLWIYGGTESVFGAFISAGVRYAKYNTAAFLLAPVFGVALGVINVLLSKSPWLWISALFVSVPVLRAMFALHVEVVEMAGSFALVSQMVFQVCRILSKKALGLSAFTYAFGIVGYALPFVWIFLHLFGANLVIEWLC